MNTHIDENYEQDDSHRTTGTRSARPTRLGVMQTLKVHRTRLAVSLLVISGLVVGGVVAGSGSPVASDDRLPH